MLGATALVTNSLVKKSRIHGFNEGEMTELIRKVQTKALVGSMRIVKSMRGDQGQNSINEEDRRVIPIRRHGSQRGRRDTLGM